MPNSIKIAYCLSDSGNNFYAEQILLSLESLKLYNPTVFVSILIDSDSLNKSPDNTKKTIKKIIKKVDDVIVVDFTDIQNNKLRSRLLKTSIRERISGDFLYLDGDTIVCTSLDTSIFKTTDIAAVYNTNEKKLDLSPHYHAFQHIAQKCNVTLSDNTLYNGGVIYAKDSMISRKFFNDWHRLYVEYYQKYGVTSDQISLYASNKLNKSIIRPLPGEWNCQLGYGINELSDAIIIHTLISSFKQREREEWALHFLQNQTVYESINKGIISEEEIKEIIINVKHLFLPNSRIVHKQSTTNQLQNLKAFSLKYKPLYLYSVCGEIDVVINALNNYGISVNEVINNSYNMDINDNAGVCVVTNNLIDTNRMIEDLLNNNVHHIFIL